mgnify:CR=1 FL=1
MKVRLENGELLVDFNYRGWNGEKAIDMDEITFMRFEEICDCEFGGYEDMEMYDLIYVLVIMAGRQLI